jgi:RNA polymerase sigma factor (sigma-70 family)
VKGEETLLEGLRKKDRKSQQALFQKLNRRMLAMCRRYVRDSFEAENCLMQGFMKVFSSIDGFQEQGSFEAWVRKIMVRECLQHLRKNHPMEVLNLEEVFDETAFSLPENPDYQILLEMVHALPTGYRMVFNLYAIEGYKHHEIALMLGISEGASKSQLNGARARLKEMLRKIGVDSVENMVL